MLLIVMLSLVLRLATADVDYSGSGTHDEEEGSAEYSGSGSGMGTDDEDEDYIERQQKFQGYGMVEPAQIKLADDDEIYIERRLGYGMAEPAFSPSEIDSCFEFDIHYIDFGEALTKPGRPEWDNNYGSTGSARGCQKLCRDTLGCEWFNWVRSPDQCWLKRTRGDKIKSIPGDVTGPRDCPTGCIIEIGVYIVAGGNLKSMVTSGQSECASSCASTSGCVAWTLSTSDNYCWLKSHDEEKEEEEGWITGTQECGAIELSGDGPGDYFVEPDLSIDVGIEPSMEVWEPVVATVELEEIVQENCGACTLDLLVNQTNSDGDDTETIAMAEFLLQSQEIQQLKQALEKKDIQISNLRKIAGELENYLEEVNQENSESLEAKDNIISKISEEELNQEARIEDLEGETLLMKCRQKKRKLEGKLLFRQELKDDYQQELLEKKDQNRQMKQSLDDNIALSNVNKLLFKVEQTVNEMCELIQNKQIEEMRKMEEVDPQELRIIDETIILQDEVERQRSILERQEQKISQFEAIEASQLSIMRQHQTKISQLHSQMNDLSKHEPLCLDYDYDYHDYDLDINQSYIQINNSIRASMNNSTGQDLDTQLTHLSDNLQDALSFLDETIPPPSCPPQDSYSEIRTVSTAQSANIGQIAQVLNPLLPQDRQLHLPSGNVLSYGLPQLPDDSVLTVSSVSMSCPPQTQLSTHGDTWDISCPDGECPQVEDWPECLQTPQCTGRYEFGVEYPHNDIRSCGGNKKPTAEACQEFCKSVPGCVGWEWGYDGDNCCAKSKMQNRKSGKSGRVAGLINACPPPGTDSSSGCMTSPSRPDRNGNPSKANTKCVFPFIFNRKTYNDCAPGSVAGNMPDDSLWCSTKVDSYGEHVSGQGEWGYCRQSCSDCSCSDFLNKYGFGQCKKGDTNFGGSLQCYVNTPSKCTDLKESETSPGKFLSAEACKLKSGCSCSDFISKNGYGKCNKAGWKFEEPFCYVNSPSTSTCTDLIESVSNPGNWASAEACKSGKLSLVGGSKPSEGNVFYMGKPVCDDEWTGTRGNHNADVVCRELGFSGAYSFTRESHFGSVPSSFSMDSLNCSGSESRLEDCSYSTNEDCGESEGAGVICIV